MVMFLNRLCPRMHYLLGPQDILVYRQFWSRKPLEALSSGQNGDGRVRQTKLMKKLCSTILFGTTFSLVLYAKRKKQREMSKTFEECVLLPADENYAKAHMFYKFKGFVLPDFVIREKNQIENFQVRPEDIFVVSFPKSGTTWIQEIVYLIGSDLDFKSARETGLESRFPYLEFIYPGIKDIVKMTSVRYIKSHLPFTLLPPDIHVKKPKIVYVMRNPKDVAVSYYHYVQMLTPTSYKGSFEQFLTSFINDKVMYGPLWKHNLEFWEHRNDDNILIVSYEDLHKDVKNEIRRISTFLGKAISEEDVNRISEHCSFGKMAENPSVNYKHWDDLGIHNKDSEPFMRKGIVGDWMNYFTKEMETTFEKWEEEHFQNSGVEFVSVLGNT